MTSKLTFKIELQYFSENKKVIFYKEICDDGLSTKSISIGDDRIIKKTINERILSEECLLDGITCGYAYVYDEEGKTIDLKRINENISIDESIRIINKTKKSKEFFKVEMDGLLVITNSPEFIVAPCESFVVNKQMTLNNGDNILVYSLEQIYTYNGKTSTQLDKKEKYQINDECIVLTNNSNEITDETMSFIKQLESLKELLNSSPKSCKYLKIETNYTKKTIR